jgi:hypothetical protein
MVVVKVQVPRWPLAQQTDYELRDYRERLENAVRLAKPGSADCEVYSDRLADVIAEQAERTKVHG